MAQHVDILFRRLLFFLGLLGLLELLDWLNDEGERRQGGTRQGGARRYEGGTGGMEEECKSLTEVGRGNVASLARGGVQRNG